MTALCEALGPEFGRTGARCSAPTATCGSPRTRRRTRPTRARSSPPARRPAGTSRSPPAGVRVGAGFYEASGERLARIRDAIADDRTGAELRADPAQAGEGRLRDQRRAAQDQPARVRPPTTRGSSCSATSRCSPGSRFGFEPVIHTPEVLDRVRDDWRALRPLVEWVAAQRRAEASLLAVRRHRPLGLPVGAHGGDPALARRRGRPSPGRCRRLPPSGKVVVMVPTLAHVLPLAWESWITKRNDSIGAIASSQKARIPSWPWWPSPLGVEHRRADRVLDDGVLGVHRRATRSRSPAATAAYERCEAARAGWSPFGAFQVMASGSSCADQYGESRHVLRDLLNNRLTCVSGAARRPRPRSAR